MRPEDLGFLGLMRRAGKLAAGEEGVRQAVRAGKAKLILLASDASSNAQKRAEDFSVRARVPLLVMQEDKATLGNAAGVAGGVMFAVCDEGFAASLQRPVQQPVSKRIIERIKRDTGVSNRRDSGAKSPERKKAVLIGNPDRDRQESAHGYDDEIPDL